MDFESTDYEAALPQYGTKTTSRKSGMSSLKSS